jgi:hypothetical protein
MMVETHGNGVVARAMLLSGLVIDYGWHDGHYGRRRVGYLCDSRGKPATWPARVAELTYAEGMTFAGPFFTEE